MTEKREREKLEKKYVEMLVVYFTLCLVWLFMMLAAICECT